MFYSYGIRCPPSLLYPPHSNAVLYIYPSMQDRDKDVLSSKGIEAISAATALKLQAYGVAVFTFAVPAL